MTRPDLSTSYLGLALANPLIASSSPLTRRVESLVALQEAGVAAVVLPSLFAEEVEQAELADFDLMLDGEGFAEFASAPLTPELDQLPAAPQEHVDRVRQAKAALSIPVIASVNGTGPGDWLRYAELLCEAGADAIELNMYAVNADPTQSAGQVERRNLEVIEQVRQGVDVPLTVKLSAHFTSLAHFAVAATSCGADGLVLFNRFYGADLDLSDMAVRPKLELSTRWESLLALRWIAIIRSQQPQLSLAATSGVHEAQDVIKALAVGADATYLASTLLRNGPDQVGVLLAGMRRWLTEHEYDSVAQLKGCMKADNVPNPGEFERAQYLEVLRS